jgi:hypothetical protein
MSFAAVSRIVTAGVRLAGLTGDWPVWLRFSSRIARQASDARGNGPEEVVVMHAVVRRYRGASALNELLGQRSQDVEQLLRDVPGFVAYYAIRDGDELATVTVCEDQAGTQESSRRAAEWVRQNLTGGTVGTPEITEGEAFIHFSR